MACAPKTSQEIWPRIALILHVLDSLLYTGLYNFFILKKEGGRPLQYKVLVAAEFKGLNEGVMPEVMGRLEEHGLEKIPTLSSAWEYACETEDEADAKDNAVQAFVNVVRTYPCELGLVVQAGASQILRRKKKFDP